MTSALGNETLAGMGLLAGHALQVEVVTGGAVSVVPLPQAKHA